MARWNRIAALVAACTSPVLGAAKEWSDPNYGPVTGGVDYVDLLLNKKENVDVPEIGNPDFSATLNGYTFWFKSAENKDAFESNPWMFAPHCGGFCCFAASKGFCTVGIDVEHPIYIHGHEHDIDEGNYMFLRGLAQRLFKGGLPDSPTAAESNCHAGNRSSWVFNTRRAGVLASFPPFPSSSIVVSSPKLGAYSAKECSDPNYGPVTGGVDYVDLLLNKKENVDAPETGNPDFSATLNGYTFWFKSDENKDTFEANPWMFAPHCGGFCCAAASSGHCTVGIDIKNPVYVHGHEHDIDEGNYMQLRGFVQRRFIAGLPDSAAAAESKCRAGNRSSLPFNTRCSGLFHSFPAFPSSSIVV